MGGVQSSAADGGGGSPPLPHGQLARAPAVVVDTRTAAHKSSAEWTPSPSLRRRGERAYTSAITTAVMGPATMLLPHLPTPSVPLVPDAIRGHSIPITPNPAAFAEHCLFRGGMAMVGGYLMGLVFGAAFAGFGSMGSIEGVPGGYDPSKVTATQALKDGFVQMKVRGLATARNFSIVGGVFSTIECVLEKQRGRKDMKNAIAAGAGTGAILAVRAGPRAMLVGATGFAGFSIVMDVLMAAMSEG